MNKYYKLKSNPEISVLKITGHKYNCKVLVDTCDVELLKNYEFWVQTEIDKFTNEIVPTYVFTSIDDHIIALHRLVFGLKLGDKREVDHYNRNRLDCRKSNLRLTDRSGNMHNTSLYRTNTSGRTGVKACRKHKGGEQTGWTAQIGHEGKRYTKDFPFSIYGNNAFKEACKQRRKWEKEFGFVKGTHRKKSK